MIRDLYPLKKAQVTFEANYVHNTKRSTTNFYTGYIHII
jgi:hypothetical protein